MKPPEDRLRRLARHWLVIGRRVVQEVTAGDMTLMAGGISYFGFLSLVPTLLVVVVAVGWVLGAERALEEVLGLSERALGPKGASALSLLLDPASLTAGTGLVAVGAILTSLYASTRVFTQLQQALNQTWGVRVRRRSWWQDLRVVARKRLLSLVILAGVGIFVLVSVVFKTVLGVAMSVIHVSWLGEVAEFGVSTLLVAAVLAAVYRVLPDVWIDRRDVAAGALTAALGLQLAAKVLSWYLVEVAARSLSGAAGTIVVTLLWLYFTAWILLLGAQVVQATAWASGRPLKAEPHAELIAGHQRGAEHRPEVDDAKEDSPQPGRVAEGFHARDAAT